MDALGTGGETLQSLLAKRITTSRFGLKTLFAFLIVLLFINPARLEP